ncbi:MAG: glycosyltransferase family 4 protein [Bacteroidia bacterium]|nr:glycosyltransferase family 4 protein [Bacteroidia bacterium]
MKILFLYSEVAGYFLRCAERLHQLYGCEIHVVRWPVHPEAPFQFRTYEGVTFYERRELSDADLYALYKRLNPSLVYTVGWLDPGYLRLSRQIRQDGIPVVCGIDTHWRGDLRQQIAVQVSPWRIKPCFSHMWTPGLYQYEYARRLGYAREHILPGLYCADVAAFEAAGRAALPAKTQQYPRQLLYVGRFVEVKGVRQLYEAFTSLTDTERNGWTLSLTGAGPLRSQLPETRSVQVRDFVQPEDLPGLAQEAGAFILPSTFEPWGVVMHEFAAAGLPLLASHACGAATAFIRAGYNGWTFSGTPESLRAALVALFQTADHTLLRMGQRSQALSHQITPESWAATLMQVLNPYISPA